MADVKYPDYTPVDEPIRTGPKPAEPGSGIRVEKEPAPKPAPKSAPKVEKKANGGHVHHSEHYGKHASGHKLHMDHVKAMCGGGYAKGKK